MCFVWLSEQTTIITQYKLSGFITETELTQYELEFYV